MQIIIRCCFVSLPFRCFACLWLGAPGATISALIMATVSPPGAMTTPSDQLLIAVSTGLFDTVQKTLADTQTDIPGNANAISICLRWRKQRGRWNRGAARASPRIYGACSPESMRRDGDSGVCNLNCLTDCALHCKSLRLLLHTFTLVPSGTEGRNLDVLIFSPAKEATWNPQFDLRLIYFSLETEKYMGFSVMEL